MKTETWTKACRMDLRVSPLGGSTATVLWQLFIVDEESEEEGRAALW